MQRGIVKEGLLRRGVLESTAAAHTRHLLPGEEAIPSHPASSSPPAFLSLTLHPATSFPVCFHMEDLNKEAEGKHVCGADVEFMACAMTIPLVPYFILPFAHTWQRVQLSCVLYGDWCNGTQSQLDALLYGNEDN